MSYMGWARVTSGVRHVPVIFRCSRAIVGWVLAIVGWVHAIVGWAASCHMKHAPPRACPSARR
eukprot:4632165-Prymnesium_polylepis.1